MSISSLLFGLFSDMGDAGIVLCIFILFLIDAFAFPTLPELFMVLGFSANPDPWFGAVLLLTAMTAEMVGVLSLYLLVSRIRVPERISKVANRYIGFLLVNDERIVLVNRVAPMIPFLGAFIAMVDGWNVKKCLAYNALGCLLKYGTILLANGFFIDYLGSDKAQTVTLVFIIAVIAASFAASFFRKRREGLQ